MNKLKFLVAGTYFGFILIKSEAISWYRIIEMFHFQSFHMYGIIGSAILVGALSIYSLKKWNIKSIEGEIISPNPKPNEYKSNFIGGTLFGLGWSIVGACTAPLFVLIGSGHFIVIVPLIFAFLGVVIFGLVKHKLPY